MHHSHLLVNVSDNPDRPDWNITRRWLRNLYRVHQRLCMAFAWKVPTSQEERMGAYCAPFCGTGLNDARELPGEPDTADVHHARSDEAGFLFRIDYPIDHERGIRRPVIIVQSAGNEPPDWHYAFGLNGYTVDDRGRPIGNAGFLLAAPPQTKRVSIELDGDTLVLTSRNENHRIACGNLVRFRLRANPTRKVQDGPPNGRRKRINPTLADHTDWLAGKLASAADSPVDMAKFVTGWAYGWRTKHEPQPSQRMQWWSVLFEGTFRVGDVSKLKKLLESGIGPAKAFGFGLLSIAPVRE
jgi:CRISPR-associated protein Cas6/Cse3/CasE subtype I-E